MSDVQRHDLGGMWLYEFTANDHIVRWYSHADRNVVGRAIFGEHTIGAELVDVDTGETLALSFSKR